MLLPTRPFPASPTAGRPRARGLAAQALAALAGAVLALPGARAAETLTLAVGRSTLALPVYVAQAQGFFADSGLDVRLDECVGGSLCLERLAAGRADVAATSEMPVVLAGFEGARFAIIATIATSTDDVKVVARRRYTRGAAGQLAGRRIGVVAGSAGQYVLDVELMNLGIDPRGVDRVELAPGELAPALRTGRVDAVVAREPLASEIERDRHADAAALPVSGVYVGTFDLVVDRGAAARRAPMLERLLQAIDRAEGYINDQPQEAQAVLREHFGVDGTVVDPLWPGIGFRLSLQQSLLATMESEARWAVREARVAASQRPNVLTLIDAGPMKAAKPGAVGTGS